MSISRLKSMLGSHSLVQDIAYTMISFLVLAISGVFINVVITLTRSPQSLGVFNLSYIVYLVLGQIASVGMQYSVLRNTAHYKTDKEILSKLMCTGASIALASGVLVACLLCWFCLEFKSVFRTQATCLAITYSTLGLALFPLNKVLQAYLNGLRHMKLFSIIQGIRYILVMVLVSTVSISSLPIEYATLSFFVAELVAAILGCWFIYTKTPIKHLIFDMSWMKKHLNFGLNAFFFTVLADSNIKLNILLIGLFLDEKSVGIYSFAAILVDGLYHILSMVRINFNPSLVTALVQKKIGVIQQMLQKSKKYVFPMTCVLASLIFVCFYFYTSFIVPEKGLQQGTLSLFILLSGLVMISYLVPFDNLLVVSGYPGYQTIQQITMVATNFVVTFALIFKIGILGAALGTIIGYFLSIVVLVYLSKRLIGWNLLTNTYCGVL